MSNIFSHWGAQRSSFSFLQCFVHKIASKWVGEGHIGGTECWWITWFSMVKHIQTKHSSCIKKVLLFLLTNFARKIGNETEKICFHLWSWLWLLYFTTRVRQTRIHIIFPKLFGFFLQMLNTLKVKIGRHSFHSMRQIISEGVYNWISFWCLIVWFAEIGHFSA